MDMDDRAAGSSLWHVGVTLFSPGGVVTGLGHRSFHAWRVKLHRCDALRFMDLRFARSWVTRMVQLQLGR